MHIFRTLILLLTVAIFSQPARAEEAKEAEEGTKKTIEAPSPDGKFAFLFTANPDAEEKTYDLIEKKSGKVLARVAESDPNLGSSARFHMEVLWRSDSKAFALTATLWKRASEVSVYVRDGVTFRKVKLPELGAEFPKKATAGKSFPHIVALNSQSATRWQKDGSLTVEIENIADGGDDGTISAKRTVLLGFKRSNEASLLKSRTKVSIESE